LGIWLFVGGQQITKSPNKQIHNHIMTNIAKARAANKILVKAGVRMIKSSFDTTKTIASLYKNAGLKAFKFGSGLLKETLKLAADTQKELLQTSGAALKETVATLRAEDKPAAKTPKKEIRKKKKSDTSIDAVMREAVAG
jgi:hypothetical protein